MAQAQIMTKAELLPLVKQQRRPWLAHRPGRRRAGTSWADWDDQTLLQSMGRSCKLPGAIWAIEWRVGPLVAMQAEAEDETDVEAALDEMLAAE
jgi:hypothetical protein